MFCVNKHYEAKSNEVYLSAGLWGRIGLEESFV